MTNIHTIHREYAKGNPATVLAYKYGISYQALLRQFHSHGLSVNRPGDPLLTERQVRDIRRKFASQQYSKRELARSYNVTWATIHRIVKRETWKHVTTEDV